MIKKYDFIFSIGEACSCTQNLRQNGLQIASYPFDWLWGGDFSTRINLVVSKFKRYIDKSDLEYSYEGRGICNAYHNKFNDITFNHDFSKTLPFDEAYVEVKKKYDRRIERLLNNIAMSKSVLVVCIETPTKNHPIVDIKTIEKSFDKLVKAYPNTNIDLLYLKNNLSGDFVVEHPTSNITIMTLDYKQKDSDVDYTVDGKKLRPILKSYKLNLPLMYRIKKILLCFCIELIPITSIRHKLQRKYHVK